MINEELFEKYKIGTQVLFWVIFIVPTFIQGVIAEMTWQASLSLTALYCLAYAIPIYLNQLILIPALLEKRRYLLYILSFIAVATLSCYIYLQCSRFIDYDYYTRFRVNVWLFTLPFICLFMGTTSYFRFAVFWFQNLRYQEELKKNKVETELNFLKAQIQPHFLFNTLNNIYSYAHIQHPDTPEMIANLSNILRYIVYDSKKERVSLEKELKTIKTLIALYKVKNSQQKNIKFETSNINSGHVIAPLILVSLVENAFKHSDALHNNQGFIHLGIWVDESNKLIFNLKNSLKSKDMAVFSEGGIGNKNIIRQLELTYQNKYSFESLTEKNEFHQTLILQTEFKELNELQSTHSR